MIGGWPIPCLVRSTYFSYDQEPVPSGLASASASAVHRDNHPKWPPARIIEVKAPECYIPHYRSSIDIGTHERNSAVASLSAGLGAHERNSAR